MVGEVASPLDRRDAIASSMHDRRRHMDCGEKRADIGLEHRFPDQPLRATEVSAVVRYFDGVAGDPVAREVGTVTVMFTDLAGSTVLRSRLGEEAADRLRGVHDAVLTDAIVTNGGRVVKHLGDGFMAAFPSAAGAVGAAVVLQQEIDRVNRRGGPEVMLVRVGISTGDVTFKGDDCFGLPVVEAQRLEASAEPGTIRCAEMVKLLARGRGGHEYVPLGELTLKGLAQPLASCEVRWTPLGDDLAAGIEVGLPPVFAYAGGLPFCGRDDVFEQLADAWKRCAAGGFETVLLAGEPGIGKTRLTQELATRVHGGVGVVLAGRCDEDVAVPFQAYGAALDWQMRQTAADARLAALGEYPGDLVRLLPDLGSRVAGLPAALQADAELRRSGIGCSRRLRRGCRLAGSRSRACW